MGGAWATCVCARATACRAPGKLPFLRCPSFFELSTFPLRFFSSMISTTSITIEPSAKSSRLPGLTLWQSLAYEQPIFVSVSVLYPSKLV